MRFPEPFLPLPAAEAMALALYDARHGYYRRAESPWGFAGKDYYTALDCGPLMGEAVARRLEAVWQALDRPGTFTVLEPGAGRGWLGRDLLQAATGAFREALQYVHQDDNPAARLAAEMALGPWLQRGQAHFAKESETLPPFTGAVLSNELFDALPAQPYRFHQGRWEQVWWTEEAPRWEPAPRDAAVAWFEAQGAPAEGDGSLWVESLPTLLEKLLEPLRQGLFLTFDYGHGAAELLAKASSLRRYRGHQVDERWWEAMGEWDLTGDVDFTRLEACLNQEGLQVSLRRSLGAWIRAHAPLAAWEAEWMHLDPAHRLARTQNLLQLTLPNLLGERFQALEASRGIPELLS